MTLAQGALARKLYLPGGPAPAAAKPAAWRSWRCRRKAWRQPALAGAGALLLVTLMVIVYLGLCTRIVQKQYALDHYESLLPALREENAGLRLQVRILSRPSRVEKIARTMLHMEVPQNRILIVQSNGDRPVPKYAWKGAP